FFFQAEDGIRGFHVTGVQTCALPIYRLVDQRQARPTAPLAAADADVRSTVAGGKAPRPVPAGAGNVADGGGAAKSVGKLRLLERSEERRVGKDGGQQRVV